MSCPFHRTAPSTESKVTAGSQSEASVSFHKATLSPEAAAIVAATAGVVAANAVNITTCFYPKMFAAHPELQRVFNQGNQASGDQRRALAASVVAYAVQLIDPKAPSFEPVLQRIAHKHVSVGIRAEQYTIVGKHIMEAIGEVLGAAVTPAVAAAWGEVYWLFAVQLIAAEARIYMAQHVDPAYPWRRFRVSERVAEATDVVSFVMSPTDGRAAPSYTPGMYVSVAIDFPDGSRQPRQYTLSRRSQSDALQITVRRQRGRDGQPDGRVSTFLHEKALVGFELDVSAPCGDVFLTPSTRPLLLVSAGVGITPFAAMLDEIAESDPGRPVTLAHADRSPAHHALFDACNNAGSKLDHFATHIWYEEGADAAPKRHAKAGRISLADVPLADDVEVFMCGPLPFMRDVRAQLIARSVPSDSIRYEVFGPDLWAQRVPDAEAPMAAAL